MSWPVVTVRRLLLLTTALFWSRILCAEMPYSREVEKRCWENTSVTDPIVEGGTLQMFCDPCETQKPGASWAREWGTWERSRLRRIEFKFLDRTTTVGRYTLNWDMSCTIDNVQRGDAGRYRCSRRTEDGTQVFSWHEVVVRDPSKLHVSDIRKRLRPIKHGITTVTRWSEWSVCSNCDHPGSRERIGYCYFAGGSPLKQYHNGLPCNFPPNYLWWEILRINGRDEKEIEGCRATCREADKQVRYRKVRPYYAEFFCKMSGLNGFQTVLTVLEGESIRLKCHHCAEIYSGVKWYSNIDEPVPLDWHDNEAENRVVLNVDMSLEIRRANRKKDQHFYMCISKKSAIYSFIFLVVKTRSPKMHIVDLTKNQAPYAPSSRSLVFTRWSDWGPCSTCGKPGTRVRMGFCYSTFPAAVRGKFATFLHGVPCYLNLRSGNHFAWSTHIKEVMLDEKMIGGCNEPCFKPPELPDIFSSSVQRYAAARKPGQNNPWARPQPRPEEDRVETKVTGYIGDDVNLLCPGASAYAVTEWKNGSHMVVAPPSEGPEPGTNATRGRVYVDDISGELHISGVAAWDSQLYHCFSNGVKRATVRFVVMKPLVDMQAFMGSFFQIGNVFGFYAIIFVFLLILKCIARCIQNRRIKRSLREPTG